MNFHTLGTMTWGEINNAVRQRSVRDCRRLPEAFVGRELRICKIMIVDLQVSIT